MMNIPFNKESNIITDVQCNNVVLLLLVLCTISIVVFLFFTREHFPIRKRGNVSFYRQNQWQISRVFKRIFSNDKKKQSICIYI